MVQPAWTGDRGRVRGDFLFQAGAPMKPTKAANLNAPMRLKNRVPSVNWMMIFVLAVVILGIVLIATGEFGAA
jgi:hypothetical protein